VSRHPGRSPKDTEAIRVTRFGEPLAEIVPSTGEKNKGRKLGSMKIVSDITGRTGSFDDWDAWQE